MITPGMPINFFSTTGSAKLADDIFAQLSMRVEGKGIALAKGVANVTTFANENIQVSLDTNVRNSLAVVVFTQTPDLSNQFFEVWMLINALKGAKVGEILLVMPYMPYARSDKKDSPRISVGGVDLASFFSEFQKINNVLLLDPHSVSMKEQFKPAADEVTALPLLAYYIMSTLPEWGWSKDDTVVIFADNGAANRFEQFPSLLGMPQGYIHKGRNGHNVDPNAYGLVGDVTAKNVLLLDDEILTGGTTVKDAGLLKEKGAKSITMAFVHPVLRRNNVNQLEVVKHLTTSVVDRFITTSSVPCDAIRGHEKFTILPIAPLLAEAVRRMYTGESLSELRKQDRVHLYL